MARQTEDHPQSLKDWAAFIRGSNEQAFFGKMR
jgi:hypothetical protein